MAVLKLTISDFPLNTAINFVDKVQVSMAWFRIHGFGFGFSASASALSSEALLSAYAKHTQVVKTTAGPS